MKVPNVEEFFTGNILEKEKKKRKIEQITARQTKIQNQQIHKKSNRQVKQVK